MYSQRDWIYEMEEVQLIESSRAMADIAKRLPKADRIRVPDLAAATNVSKDTVIGWIESGSLPATNVGTGTKKYYEIIRRDFLDFWKLRESRTTGI